jgi:serine protease
MSVFAVRRIWINHLSGQLTLAARVVLAASVFLLPAWEGSAAPLTEAQLTARARCEVLVKLRSARSMLDGASLLPPELQERLCDAGPALPVPNGDVLSRELQKIKRLRFSDEPSAVQAVEILRASAEIEWAEPRLMRYTCGPLSFKRVDFDHHLDGPSRDPFYPLQWGLPRVQAEAGWDLTNGDSNIVIAVCDLGIDFMHSDLAPQQWTNLEEMSGAAGVDDDDNGVVDDFYGYDWVDLDGDASPENDDAHGTHVAGIATAVRNNGLGISGIAGDCRLMSVRCGIGTTVPYGYEGIWYAARAGAKVINCSWSGYGFSNYESEIIEYAQARGCVLVASVGNEGETTSHYPATYAGVIGVAATDIADIAASFTNRGPWVGISAPGVDVFSTLPQNSYGYASGTSMSCPLVAGAAALVWSRWPDLTGDQVRARVVSSADPIDIQNMDWVGQLGLGRLNVYRAVADSLPGIRLAQIEWQEIAGDMDGRLEPGERGLLTVPVYNDLGYACGVTGFLEAATSHARIVRPVSSYGDLSHGGPYNNRSPLFEIEILSSAQNGLVIPLSIEWSNEIGRVLARTTYRLQADPQTATLSNGALALGVGENGCLGFYDYIQDEQVGVGLQDFARPSNLLWHGSLLIGAHGVVSDNCFGNTAGTRFDFAAVPDSIAWVGPSPRADLEARAYFRDSGSASPLFVDVDARVLAFTGAEADHLFILEFTIANRGLNVYEDAYVGLFLDWDIPNYAENFGDFDLTGDLAYVGNTLPGFSWGGVASISHPFTAFQLLDNAADLYSGGWSDERKWEILTGDIAPVEVDTMTDVSEIVGLGPFRLDTTGTQTVAVVIVVGDDLAALRTLAERARALYSPTPMRPLADGPQSRRTMRPVVFPNPATSGAPLQVTLPAGEAAEFRLYNILGQQVGPVHYLDASPGGQPVRLPSLPGASGVFFYRIETRTDLSTGRLLILK